MENLSLVAAIGEKNELGLDNRLIWKIKEDLIFYRNLTMHKNIIMGRKTFESMPSAALQGRNVYVLSSQKLDKHYDVNSYDNIESILQFIEITKQEFIVVGGSSIYEAFLPYVDTMYLTEIEENAPADTYFPYIDILDWEIETIYNHKMDYTTLKDVSYIRNKYVRRRIK